MKIKKLINSEEEYLDFAWKFINPDKEIWRPEDIPKLQPFFTALELYSRETYPTGGPSAIVDIRGPSAILADILQNEEVIASNAHWRKCRELYADEMAEIKDCTSGFSQEDLIDFFLLKNPYSDLNSGDIEITRESLKVGDDFNVDYPFVFCAKIESEFVKGASLCFLFSEFVERKDFE